jgi:hypothetical protein
MSLVKLIFFSFLDKYRTIDLSRHGHRSFIAAASGVSNTRAT